jgi:hypothetical protein
MNGTNELSPIEKDYIESFQNAMEDELRRLRLRKRRKSLMTPSTCYRADWRAIRGNRE